MTRELVLPFLHRPGAAEGEGLVMAVSGGGEHGVIRASEIQSSGMGTRGVDPSHSMGSGRVAPVEGSRDSDRLVGASGRAWAVIRRPAGRAAGRTRRGQAGPVNWLLPRKHSAPSPVGASLFRFRPNLQENGRKT